MGPCLWEATATNFACGALMALAPVYLVRELHAPAGLVGVLIASEGIGTLLGATLVSRANRRLGTARAILVSGFAAALSTLLLPAGHGVVGMVCFALGNAGFATGVVIGSVNTRTYRQTASPPVLLSRVMATTRFVSWGAVPVGALLAGLVASGLGVRTALWCMAASAFVPTLVLLTSRVALVRDLEDVEVPDELAPVAG
jgi:predicted MFS family arabinose efflux permease